MKKYLSSSLSCIVWPIIASGCFVLLMPVSGAAQSASNDIALAIQQDSLAEYSAEILVWDRVIRQQPKMAQAWHLRGKAKYQVKDYYGAIADQQQAAKLQPASEPIFLASAYARLALKQYKAAVADFSKAIAINPSNSITWYHRGFTRQKLQQLKQARLDFNRANELGLKDARDILTEAEPE